VPATHPVTLAKNCYKPLTSTIQETRTESDKRIALLCCPGCLGGEVPGGFGAVTYQVICNNLSVCACPDTVYRASRRTTLGGVVTWYFGTALNMHATIEEKLGTFSKPPCKAQSEPPAGTNRKPWNGPDLGGEGVVVERRGGRKSVFLSPKIPAGCRVAVWTSLGYEPTKE
jgi:hypothetical protein